MPFVFRYFWFLCALLMLINVVIWRRRLMVVVARGVATQREMDGFLRWAALGLVGGSILLGLIGLAARWSSPLCAGMLSFADVPRTLVSAVVILGGLALLSWVWRGNGADFLARVGPALGQRPSYDRRYSPAIVRAVVTLLILGSGLGSTIMWRTMPIPAELGCPSIAVAG